MKVSVILSFTAATFDTGAVGGLTQVELLSADSATVIATNTTDYVFANVAVGDYVLRASRLDANDGAILGEPITQTITVSPATVQIDLPAGMTVNVTAD